MANAFEKIVEAHSNVEWASTPDYVGVQLTRSAASLVTSGSVGRHDWHLADPTEDGILVFVDDRPVSYCKTQKAAHALAMEVIQRLVADGDYRLNDRPAGFMPPSLPPAGHRKLPVYYGCSRDPVGVMTVAEAARWGDRNIPKDLKR